MQKRFRQRRRRDATRWVALLAVAMTTFNVAADKVYKWTDDDGHVHYGDRPPADSERREMLLRRPPRVDPDINIRQQRTARLLQSFAAEREEKQAARAAAVAQKKEREARCAKARETQQKYENSAFIYTKDAAGERVILDDDAHAEVMADARAAVENWCR